MSRAVLALLAVLAVAHVAAGFRYRIEVHTAQFTKETQGKFFGLMTNLTQQHEIKLTPHATPLKPNFYYAYAAEVPMTVETVQDFHLKYRKRNFLAKSTIGINKVVVLPAYLGPNAGAYAMTFCPTSPSLEIKTDVYYRLVRC